MMKMIEDRHRGDRGGAAGLMERRARSREPFTIPAREFDSEDATQLIDRDTEVAELARMLGMHRLVTIVGPAGVGKTAVADALCQPDACHPGRRVATLELAPLADGRQLLPALVTALKVPVGAADPREAVLQALCDTPWLLVLDNCEHLLADVAVLVGDLLDALPQLHILQTSQEALNLQFERVYRLGTLRVPEPDADLETARQAGAVAMLVARASAADQHFELHPGNRAQVIDVCRQLDGHPLAIELAAARIRSLGVEGLRARLDDRLRVLSAGARDLPARHRTLRAALEWSHALLSPVEQIVFRRLGVMSGTFDMAAAQHVARGSDLDAWTVLDAVHGLTGKSLLVSATDGQGEARFHFLETMRHWALDRVQAAGELASARDRHLDHFLSLAEAASQRLDGPQQGAWLARLDHDRDNLAAAHRHCDTIAGGAELGLRLVTALIRYWFNRGALLQGQQIIEQALARPGAERHAALFAMGQMHSGRLFAFRALDQEATLRFRRAIDVGRTCGALATVVESLARLGYARLGLGDRDGARGVLEEAHVLARGLPDGASGPRAVALSHLAELERLEGRFDAAAPLYEEGLRINLERGDRQATMISMNNLAMIALALRDTKTVRQRLLESLAICDELDSRRGRLVVMEVCAGLAADLGSPLVAVFFDAAAQHHTTAMGRRRDVADAAFLAPRLERAQRAVAASRRAAEEARAVASAYSAVVGEMHRWLNTVLDPVDAAGAAAAGGEVAVTHREREVASLIARGFNNNDIARLLDLSVLTVRTHRQRLMDKLELRNAAEITAHAVRMGWYDPG